MGRTYPDDARISVRPGELPRMPYFFLKVIAPRPTFGEDANEDELANMNEHFVYWQGLLERRIAVIFGPVREAEGTYGMTVIETDDEASARHFADEDPAVAAGVVRITVSPMRVGGIRAS